MRKLSCWQYTTVVTIQVKCILLSFSITYGCTNETEFPQDHDAILENMTGARVNVAYSDRTVCTVTGQYSDRTVCTVIGGSRYEMIGSHANIL